ncbi:MAG TPA: ketopantoate reductase C-terminal domain-containing protein [Burkholderiales bacterium]
MAPRARAGRFPVAVVGPGALGSLFAAHLSRVIPTAVVGRHTAELPQADWVIILVKAYDTPAAVRTARRMKPKGIVSLQNGLIESVPQGVTTAAAYRVGRRVVPVTTGSTLLPPGFEKLGNYLREAGFEAHVTHAIRAARLGKLLANVCLNPVTALFRVRNGALREPPYAILAEALALEAAPVLRAEGLRITQKEAIGRVMEVAKRTARNRSSMLQDLLAGRRTENDHLTGALLRLARKHRLAVPTHAALHGLIRVMEQGLESSGQRRM